MTTFDLILLSIIGLFSLAGLWFGFVHTLGSLLGTVLGAYLAGRYYEQIADWLMHLTGWGGNNTRVFVFILAFIIINRLIGFGFWIVNKFARIITSLPFIKSIDRLLGLLLGLLEGVVTIGLVIYFIERFPLSTQIMELIAKSVVAPYTTKVAVILLPLLPEALKMLRSSVDYVEKKII